jgi:hypothetical protein
MPVIIAWIGTLFLSIAGSLVSKVLVSLGIGYITYTGVDLSIGWAKAQFLSNLSGVPAAAVGIASVMKVGVCVSMLLSAITARATLMGMSAAGSIKKMAVK